MITNSDNGTTTPTASHFLPVANATSLIGIACCFEYSLHATALGLPQSFLFWHSVVVVGTALCAALHSFSSTELFWHVGLLGELMLSILFAARERDLAVDDRFYVMTMVVMIVAVACICLAHVVRRAARWEEKEVPPV